MPYVVTVSADVREGEDGARVRWRETVGGLPEAGAIRRDESGEAVVFPVTVRALAGLRVEGDRMRAAGLAAMRTGDDF